MVTRNNKPRRQPDGRDIWTRASKVPTGSDCVQEIKHDGFRLIVQRQGQHVRLFTRRGYDWSERYPLIVKAALRLRTSSFVIDGEAVVLGPDGVSDFAALFSGKRNDGGNEMFAS